MADPEDKLRKTALGLCMVQIAFTSVLPALSYYYVFRLDNYGLGPQAWMIWAAVLFLGLLSVMAHGGANVALTAVHLVFGTLLAAAIGAYATAWSFVIQLQCSVAQVAYAGCAPGTCPCAAAGTCSAADLAAPGCAGCQATAADICAAVQQSYVMYILAFTGLGALVSALPALCYDVQILMAVAARRAASAAKLQALAVAVEQQTRLIAAGDKPTVTPGTLSDWVSGLLATRDKAFVNTAERCRLALRGRGYELPVKVGGKGTGQVKKREPADEGGGGKGAEGTPVVTEGTGGSGAVPSSRAGNLFRAATNSGEVDGGEGSLDAAEKGTKRPPKRQQVTPEDTPKTPVWVPVSLDSLRDA